jgi:type VI secretion system secreted protein VgrG
MADLLQNLQSILSQLVNFTGETRLYDIDTPLGNGKLMVENWVAREELSNLYEYRITCLSTDTHIELKSLLGQQITLKTRLPDRSQHSRTGWVSTVSQLGSDGGLARYQLTMVPWLWMSTQRRTSRVFQELPVLSIIEQVLAADSPRNNWRITDEAKTFLDQAQPRSYCCQYRETDYAFVTRLLAEEGIGFYFEEDPDGTSQSTQRMVLFADSTQFPEDYSSSHENGGKGIRFHRDGATETQDTIQKLGAERISQAEVTTISGWDYKSKSVISASLPTAHPSADQETPPIESADWLGIYPFSSQAEAQRTVRILREAADARTKTWFGESSVRTFQPGHAFVLTQGPFGELDAFGLANATDKERRFALLGTLQAGVNNLPSGVKQHIEASAGPGRANAGGMSPAGGLHLPSDPHAPKHGTTSPLNNLFPELYQVDQGGAAHHLDQDAWEGLLEKAKQTGYANRFTAIRSDIVWRPALQDGTGLILNPKPTALGSQTAIVVGADGTTANAGTVHTDALGRIRIRYHWQTGDSNTCWVRVAQMFAGPGYGAQFIPRIGQEVLVKFFANDIDRPIVNGVLYNGQGNNDTESFAAGDHKTGGQDNLIGAGASPAWHGAAAGEHGHAGHLSGFKSVALGSDGHAKQTNQLVFDDTTGRLRTQLATDHAATQLNMGHLIHQSDNFRGSYRGTGWELRTDAYGAIRAGSGLLMTTYYGTTPDGQPEPAGENTPGLAMLKQAKGFADTFNQAAATHQTVEMIAAKGDKTLNQGENESALDEKLPPLAAMLKHAGGQVDAYSGDADPSSKNKVPHSTAPLVTVAVQGGLGMTASDGLHYAAGETAHFTSGRDTNIAIGDTLSMHSGQALGILAGAVSAGEDNSGIKFYAGQGDIDLQAQADSMTFAAKDILKMVSVNSHVDMAAAKSITLCVEGGASLTIEGGNITFACPGMLSIKASAKNFSGPGGPLDAPLPVFQRADLALKETPPEGQVAFSVQHIPGPSPMLFAGQPYTLLKNGAEIKNGLFDDYGRLTIDKAEKGARYQVKLFNGTKFDIPVVQHQLESDKAKPDYNEHQLSNKGYRADGQGADKRLAQKNRGRSST